MNKLKPQINKHTTPPSPKIFKNYNNHQNKPRNNTFFIENLCLFFWGGGEESNKGIQKEPFPINILKISFKFLIFIKS